MIEADHAQAIAARPLLAAAWPELAAPAPDARAPLARRAAALRTQPPPMRILAAASLEDEASQVAEQVLAWLRAGARSIALVALDRVVARRVRALLERAQVLVRDETGWKLATTSAAGAVMRWLEVAGEDGYWRDLLDLLKSPFVLADRADKAQVVVAIERAVRASGVLRGTRAIRAALAERAGRNHAAAQPDIVEAVQLMRAIDAHARTARRGVRTLAAHARTLAAALDALGMRKALALDPAGRAVLRELDALTIALDGETTRVDLAAFRALLAERLEEAGFVDDAIDSPVVLVSLAATLLRDFDAALLVGADAEHLPATAPDALFMSSAVRAELGLATAAELAHEQHVAVASLLARVPEVAASWCRQRRAEPNALAPLLDRLRLAHECAGGAALVQQGGRAPSAVAVSGAETSQQCSMRPAPRAADLLPARLAAGGVQSLIDCAYQFYARHLLGLRQPDDVVEEPAKREFGEALHAVLYRFHREWGTQDFAAVAVQRLRESLAGHVQAVFAPRLARQPAFLGLQVRCEAFVDRYVEWLQRRARAGWRWSAGERTVEASFALDGQRTIVLHGRIDRIDTDRDGRRQVIDYKARPANDLKQALAEPGEDVQLPFYGLLFALSQAGDAACAQSAAYVSFDGTTAARAAVREVAPEQPLPALIEALGARLRRDLQRICGGAPLPAIGAATVCAICEMRGLCRRDYWSSDDGAPVEAEA